MATMKIPMTVPSPRVDADQLFKAFKGTYVFASYVVYNNLICYIFNQSLCNLQEEAAILR